MVRFKNRYLLVEVVWKGGRPDAGLSEAVLLGLFRESLTENFGDHLAGLEQAALQVKFYSPVTSLCVVRCGRDHHREASARSQAASDCFLPLQFLDTAN